MSNPEKFKPIFLEIDGQTRSLKDWCLAYNVPYISAYRRMKRGKTGAEVLDIASRAENRPTSESRVVYVPLPLYTRLIIHSVRLDIPTHELALDCIEVCLNKLDKKEST